MPEDLRCPLHAGQGVLCGVQSLSIRRKHSEFLYLSGWHSRCNLMGYALPPGEDLVTKLRSVVFTLIVVAIASLYAEPAMAQRGRGRGHAKHADEARASDRNWRNYDYNRFEPGFSRYDAARYYRRDDRRYEQRRLGRNDRIYRGSDNRYYCRRDDGTTGLIIGAVGGGVLGNIIAPGDSKTLGTLIGAGAGALLGRYVDRGDVVCN